jgi:AraC family transcriptional regulator
MNPVSKALWFIEGHLRTDISLDDIAAASGVSRYHMSRAFSEMLDRSVMRYLRGRRLSEAARSLADGAPDILSVALEAGYGSHEAFTRAFREQFGVTPEQLRNERQIEAIKLVEPILMQDTIAVKLEQPRFAQGSAMLVAGLCTRYEYENKDGIPAQWQRFNDYVGNIEGEVGGVAYGVCTNSDATGFDYIAGVEVTDFSNVDRELARIRIPAQRYAVFSHRDHISTIRNTIQAIWGDWLPKSGYELADAPVLERYGAEFDPDTGSGGLEIWLPLKG